MLKVFATLPGFHLFSLKRLSDYADKGGFFQIVLADVILCTSAQRLHGYVLPCKPAEDDNGRVAILPPHTLQ